MARVLYFDCFSGASGDMILGALLDAGLPLGDLRRALGSLTIGGCDIRADKVSRAGVAATKFRLVDEHHDAHEAGGAQSHGKGAEPHHHAHRTLGEIERLIDGSALSPAGRARAKGLFRRLGETEAAIHQVPLERIHLHEVGALDSIVDIVGAVFALEWLDADAISASPLNVGGGMVQSAHGVFPVPAPATVRLLEGVPVYSSGAQAELVTPTGALIVTEYAKSFGPIPPMTVGRVGYGAGERDLPSTPNVLRILIGESAGPDGSERVAVIECEIDDMNPQLFGPLMDRLYAEGALEVFYTPVQMKKNRPGTLVTVVAPLGRRESLSRAIFRETTTIGLRYLDMSRECLQREWVTVSTPVGPVRLKIARLGGEIVNAAPEFEDCARVAAESGLPLKDVQALATKAYLDGTTETGH